MGKKHYHVLTGLGGGYMPNSNEVYDTKAEALRGAREMKAAYVLGPHGFKVKGVQGILE